MNGIIDYRQLPIEKRTGQGILLEINAEINYTQPDMENRVSKEKGFKNRLRDNLTPKIWQNMTSQKSLVCNADISK